MKKILKIMVFLGIFSIYAGDLDGLDSDNPNVGSFGGSATTVAATAAQPTNFGFAASDFQNLLMPVWGAYGGSGLTTYFYQGKNILPDTQLPQFLQTIQKSISGQSDDLPLYRSLSASHASLDPKDFLQNQGSQIMKNNTGWFNSIPIGPNDSIAKFIQSGFANSVSQYAAAAIETVTARLAIGVSAFQTAAAQSNGGFLGLVNPQVGPIAISVTNSNEPAIITNFSNMAQLFYLCARYSRTMNLFPESLSVQLNAASDTFMLPTNANDSNFVNNGTSALNPMNTFCGVIVINDIPGNNIVQVGSNNQPWAPAIHSRRGYAPVFFLPATVATSNANQIPAYNSYAPVDSNFNTYTGTGTNIIERAVSFNFTGQPTISGYTVSSNNPITITVSTAPAASDSSSNNIFYVNNSTTALDALFNTNDMSNFFTIPVQWAVVVKVTSTAINILGLVKLNPYDFPLNFTTSVMQTALGVSTLPATAPAVFSQKDIWDAPFSLYRMTAPEKTSIDYSFAYLMLRGLFNGYLMSNTYSSFFNPTEWPQAKSVSPAYNTYYGLPSIYGQQSLFLDQVYPTPLASDWLGKSSPVDWFFLRALIGMRLILQSIYCPYDALVIPANRILASNGNAFITNLSAPDGTPITSVLEYMFYNPNQTVEIKASLKDTYGRFVYGQNYISSTATTPSTSQPSTSYQWILPAAPPPPTTTSASAAPSDDSSSDSQAVTSSGD